MKLLKITASALAALTLASALSSCSGGIRGVDPVDWTEYDELIASAQSAGDADEHIRLLHSAEDMLMATSCVIPLYDYRDAYMQKPDLTGVYSTHFGAKYFMYADTAAEDGVISAYLGELPDSFDPALATTIEALTVVSNTFSGLYTHDADGGVKPALCESCDVSKDGLTYIFRLREGLLWSDGSKLGASDFIFSWRRVVDASTGSPYEQLFDMIARDEDGKLMISADESDTTLTVTLSSPCSYFIELCAFPAFYPVNESCVESAEGYLDIYDNIVDPDAWTESINYTTCGAYVYAGITDGRYVFRRNDKFYDAANAGTDTLELLFSVGSDNAYSLYNGGSLDYLGAIPSDVHDEVKGTSEYFSDDINGVYYLAFDFNASVFSGMTSDNAAKLRRAVSLYIDREYITRKITEDGEEIATSIVPASISGGEYRQNGGGYEYPYPDGGYYSVSTDDNRELAWEIIKELGMDADGDGKLDPEYRFTLSYLTGDSKRDIDIAQSIQQDLSELGIMVKVSAVSDRVFDFESGIYNYDVIALGSLSYYDDPNSTLERWTTDAFGNYSRLGSLLVEENENAY